MLKIALDILVFVEDEQASARKYSSICCRSICETLHQKGIVEVAVSTRFEADKEHDRDAARVARHFRRLVPYEPVPAGFRCDISRLGVDLLHGDSGNGDIIGELEYLFTDGIVSVRRRRHSMFDADHIWAHWAGRRDYFITDDGQAFRLRRDLWRRFGI